MTIGLIDFNRIREFDELLGENVIDIRKLRRLCFNGTNIQMFMCGIYQLFQSNWVVYLKSHVILSECSM